MFNHRKAISFFMAMLLSFSAFVSAESANIKTYSNGNDVTASNIFNNGVFSAVSEGSGLFAIALYSDNELQKISIAQSEEELEEYRVNMVVDDAEDYIMKVFRFDENGNPLCVNRLLNPYVDNRKIYLNETFTSGPRTVDVNNRTTILSDGSVQVVFNGSDKGTRFGLFTVPYPKKNIIVEADFELGENYETVIAQLFSIYDNGPKPLAYLDKSGLRLNASGSETNKALVSREQVNNDKNFNVALKINLEELTYDLYYNHKKVTETSHVISSISPDKRYDGFDMYIPIVASEGSIYVDNIRAYSGTEFAEIGEQIPNVHKMDINDSPNWETAIYERPDSSELAQKVMAASHPRILWNKEKVLEIKNTQNSRIIQWKDSILKNANNYLEKDSFKYNISSSDSIDNIRDAMDMMMHLGFAYLLTGDMKYPQRAYKELKVIYDLKGGKKLPNGEPDYWNSYSYLNVAELSFTVAIAYDWMFDAWTAEQKQEIREVMDKRCLDRAYQAFYGELSPTVNGSNTWWKTENNWNSVCNGTMLLTSVAFMETDPHKCSSIMEGCIRAFEYMLSKYAPDGAWSEGVSYWAYALKFLSASCATLDLICGTDYGIHKTIGLENSQFYAISSEGKAGVLSYGDNDGEHVHAPFMFYWAEKFKNPQIGGAAIYAMKKFGFTPNIFDVLYYNEDYVTENYVQELSSYYKGTEVVTFISGHNDDDACISMSGGVGTDTSHDHLDSGGVLFEKNGLRVLTDSGTEHYAANSYFSTNRFWYYKARPEGHNIFVINPQNLISGTTLDENKKVIPVYYHGQSRDAVSEVTSYNETAQEAVMDLSGAYERDAVKAQRKIKLDGNKAIIEDDITLRSDALSQFDKQMFSDAGIGELSDISSDGNIIEWYYHFKDTATAVVGNTTVYGPEDYCIATVSEDGKSVTLSFLDYLYSNGEFIYSGITKKFTLSFESNEDFEIEIKTAERNPYDKSVVDKLINSGTFSGDYHIAKRIVSKVVVRMKNISENVKLTTIIE